MRGVRAAVRRALTTTLLTTIVGVVAVGAVLAGPAVPDTPPDAPPDAASIYERVPQQPLPPGTLRNAIVFLVDDMGDIPCGAVADYLPQSAPWLARRGTCYQNATTATPVCCPARAQVQTGQLPHNNRVRTQYEAPLLDAGDTVQHDLTVAGLRTHGIGKNLNGVAVGRYHGPAPLDTGYQRFDFWNSYQLGPGTFRLYDDVGRPYVPDTGLSSVETNGALLDEALDEYLATGERFYVHDAFFAPHKQGPRRADLPLPTPAHADAAVPPFRFAPEREARDKLPIFREQRHSRAYYRRLWTARIRTLYDVDTQMAAAFRRLEEAGVLDETAVIFTSDNGYTDRGQANWAGKGIPYPASTDVPMLAWYPGRPPAVVRRAVELVDVPATLYDVLGVPPGHVLDGHSLVGDHRRTVRYAEYYAETNPLVLAESGVAATRVKSWRLLERGRWTYVEWYRADGSLMRQELYGDPGMLRNVLWRGDPGPPPPPRLVASLQRRLLRASTCAGSSPALSANPCP